MIEIFYSEIGTVPEDEDILLQSNALPAWLREKILAYKNPKDRALRLAGKLMLDKFIKSAIGTLNINIDQLQFDESGQPGFNGQLFFSNSYSGNLAVLATSTGGAIGIDIAQRESLDISVYEDYFTQPEWLKITAAEDSIQTFYDLWTRKEALLKATGSGHREAANLFEVLNDEVLVNGTVYYITKLNLLPAYTSYLASVTHPGNTAITKVNIF